MTVEAGTQKVLNRLKKKQPPAQVERAVRETKRQGIARVHGFFVVGSPDEAEQDILESFRFSHIKRNHIRQRVGGLALRRRGFGHA